MTTLSGDSSNNVLAGTSTSDTISGGGGDDLILSGSGSDRVSGGAGDDVVLAGSGNDVVSGGSGSDYIDGGSGSDVLSGGAGGDIVDGGSGNDVVDGGGGDDLLFGGAGNDLVYGGSGSDWMFGGSGNDVLVGGAGSDTIFGGDGNDLVLGGSGDDTIYGQSGQDLLYGGAGNDFVDGGTGRDIVVGGSGQDMLLGGAGNDVMDGGGGDDVVDGGDGNDALFGGAGNDTLTGGAGVDWLMGGSGSDRFVFLDASDSPVACNMDRIADFQQGRDQIDLSALLGDTDLAWGDETALVKGAWQLNTGSGLYLLADTSGDGVADFKVELKYSCGLTLTANDILGVSGSTLAAANDSVDTTEDSAPFSFAVTGNDVGELLSVLSLDTTGTKGSVALNADGSISYGPSGQFEYLAQGDIAFDTFSYTVQDAHGAIDTATVAVTVTGTNDAPVAADDGFATHEDSSFVITKPDAIGNDSDVDAGAVLSVLALDTTGTMGSVTLHGNDGSISYDTNGQFESLAQGDIAVDTFSYTVQDEHGATDTATVTVTVTGVNDDPNAVADDVTLASGDSGAWGNVLDNDFDVDFGDTVSFTGFSFTDNNGLIHQGEFDDMLGGDLGYIVFDSQDAGHWSYHVTSGAGSGDDVFDYTIADSNGAAASGKLTISVSGTATSVVTSSVSSTDPVTTDTETPSDDTSAGDNSTPPAAAGAGTNSAPDAVADDAYVTYGNVLANDTDLDGDLLNVTGISFQGTSGELSDLVFGDYGFLMLDEGGNWTYTQNGTASANDVDVFDYTIADAHGAVDSSTLTVHAGDFIL